VAKAFKGTVNIDIKDSTPDWEPYTQPIAPKPATVTAINSDRTPRRRNVDVPSNEMASGAANSPMLTSSFR
jgi:hypothetical protein